MDRNEATKIYNDLCEIENKAYGAGDFGSSLRLIGACRATIGYFLDLTKDRQPTNPVFDYQPQEERVIERFNREKKEWQLVKFGELRDGEIFKMFESAGRYTDNRGNNVWVAVGDAVMDEHGTWSIKVLY